MDWILVRLLPRKWHRGDRENARLLCQMFCARCAQEGRAWNASPFFARARVPGAETSPVEQQTTIQAVAIREAFGAELATKVVAGLCWASTHVVGMLGFRIKGPVARPTSTARRWLHAASTLVSLMKRLRIQRKRFLFEEIREAVPAMRASKVVRWVLATSANVFLQVTHPVSHELTIRVVRRREASRAVLAARVVRGVLVTDSDMASEFSSSVKHEATVRVVAVEESLATMLARE